MYRWKVVIKKAFTLVEILLVIFIISIVYAFTISNINENTFSTKENLSLVNLKKKLLNYKFKEKIEFKCIDEGKLCYIFVDGKQTDEKIENFFTTKPVVYTYNKNLDTIEFLDLELNELDTYDVCFEFTIDKKLKSKDMIVQVDEKVYIFNSIHKIPILLEYLSDVSDYFDKKQEELKDAF